MKIIKYPKTLATIIEIVYICSKVEGPTQELSRDEWEIKGKRIGKRKWYIKDIVYKVQIDDEIMSITMSQFKYQGKRNSNNLVGKKIKMWKKAGSER